MMRSTQVRFIRGESGNVFILVAVSLIMLIIGIGVAVDMTRAFLVYSKAQSALDASLIGVSSIAHRDITQAEVDARAENFLEANFPVGYMGSSVEALTVTFDAETGRTRGSLDMDFALAFGAFLVDRIDIGVDGEVVRVLGKDLEIALALDHTASMCSQINLVSPPYAAPCTGTTAGSRIQVLSEAVQILIAELAQATEATSDPDAKLLYSYVPFNHDVKINDTVVHDGADYLPNSLGLREDADAIVAEMLAIDIDNTGNTNVSRGLLWGWRSLRAVDHSLFSGASSHEFADHPKPVGDDDTIKALVLLSDGVNAFTYFTVIDPSYAPACFPGGCPVFHDRRFPIPSIPSRDRGDAHANHDQRQLCTAIRGEGIVIFPILLNINTTTPQGLEIKDVCNACGGGPNTCLIATTAEELRAVFRRIARELINLRITK